MCRHCSECVVTRYGFHVTAIASLLGTDYPQSSKLSLGPNQLRVQCRPGPLHVGKTAGARLPPNSAVVKEKVALYVQSSFRWVFVDCARVDFTFTFTIHGVCFYNYTVGVRS